MSAVFGQDFKNIAVQFVNADATNWKDAYDNSAGSKAVRVEALNLTSDDTSTVNIQFGLLKGGTVFPFGTVRVVTLSGTDGSAKKVSALGPDALGAQCGDGIYVIVIEAGAKLQAKSLVAVTAAKTVTVSGFVRTYA